jgi:hypothetical protein
VKDNSELVMGRGAALQAMNRWPCLPSLLGAKIRVKCGHLGEYNLMSGGRVYIDQHGGPVVCAFQVKYAWHNNADLKLVKRSADKLRDFAAKNPHELIFLNFPAIGNGGADVSEVAPLLQNLPPNVTIWMLK